MLNCELRLVKLFYGFSTNFYGVSMVFLWPNLRMDAAKAALQGEFAATAFQSLRLKPEVVKWEMPGDVGRENTVDGSESQGQHRLGCKKLCE